MMRGFGGSAQKSAASQASVEDPREEEKSPGSSATSAFGRRRLATDESGAKNDEPKAENAISAATSAGSFAGRRVDPSARTDQESRALRIESPTSISYKSLYRGTEKIDVNRSICSTSSSSSSASNSSSSSSSSGLPSDRFDLEDEIADFVDVTSEEVEEAARPENRSDRAEAEAPRGPPEIGAAQQSTATASSERNPVVEDLTSQAARVALRCQQLPRPNTAMTEARPLVLATHLVPSLPVEMFMVLVEAIEAATNIPVVLIYEPRSDRPVARHVADIVIMPAGKEWKDGKLLPISFVFEHHLNKNFSPAVYADIVLATDRAPHVETIMDLRGHRCSLPDRTRSVGASTLLFDYLRSKGEGPSFFGNVLEADSQVAALQMVAGKQVEVCVLESPVIKCRRKSLPGVYSLHILTSLGPLPPYPIFVNKDLSRNIVDKIHNYLLKMSAHAGWMEKLAPYGVLGFAEYSRDTYDMSNMKSVATSAPYY